MVSNERSRKILFVLPTLHAGGSENYALRFIRQNTMSNNIWHVWSANAEYGDLHSFYEEAGCNIHYGSIGYYHPKRFYRFYKFLRQESFDVVCTFNGNFGGVALTITRLAGVTCRIAWHRRSTNAFGNNPLKTFFNSFANRLVRWNATRILSNSKYALEQFYAGYWEKDKKFKVIPNGVDPSLVKTELTKEEARRKLGLAVNAKIIGHVGRYAPAKNHETIFKVASKLINELKHDIYFLFCGKFTDSEDFLAELQRHQIAERCFILGLQSDLALVYKAIDIFYFPSITEGQPNALIEAMLADLPILSSNIPPILEMLPSGTNIAIDPYNVADASEQLIYLINPEHDIKDYQFHEWALERFDDKNNFSLFLNELIEC